MPDGASCVMCQSKVVNKQRTRISLQTGLELDQRGAHLSALISEYHGAPYAYKTSDTPNTAAVPQAYRFSLL